jgi:hypothetical protein
MRRGVGTSSALAASVAAMLTMAACGGAQQDANVPTGSFPVQVTSATFPSSQRLAQHTHLVISVRNVGHRTIPNLSVTICNTTCRYPAPVGQGTSVAAFAQFLNQPGVANHSRPVWIVDQPPGLCGYSCINGGAGANVSAAANTWQGGQLRPGATATFKWALTAVAPGKFVVAWEIGADIYGKAKAILPNGTLPEGAFPVTIAQAPAQSYVNDKGQIVQEP